MVILEDEKHAKKRSANILAKLSGYFANSDGYDMVAPSGEGATRCMTIALEDANLEPSNIDYINAHGTSTPAGDILELKAVKKTFGSHSKNLIINSTKSMIGHLLGAAGGVEAIVCILSLLNGKIHQTINIENLDQECDLNVNHESSIDCDINFALSNSFGFGGTNGSLIFSKFKD